MEEFIRATLVVALSICLCRAPAVAGLPDGAFPVGKPDLVEHRSSQEIVPGVRVYTVDRGGESPPSPWLVTAGIARNRVERQQRVHCLHDAGLNARFERYLVPGGSKPTLYIEVVGGRFRDEQKAKAAAVSPAGCDLKARAYAASPLYGAASWRFYVAEISPSVFEGHLYSSRGREAIYSRQTTSAIAQHERALLAINGGFFVMRSSDGVVGASAGISVVNGKIESGPTSRRSYLLLRDSSPVSASIASPPSRPITLRWSDESQTVVKGVNRRAGSARGCGVGDQPPAREPAQDETCAVQDDLVAVTGDVGFQSNPTAAVTFILHPDGKVDLSPAGDKNEVLLVATGRMVGTLSDKVAAALRARLDLSYAALTEYLPTDNIYAVNGAPTLLRNGAPVHDEAYEGWATVSVSRDRANFVHHWVTLRNPRTAAGVSADGTIWFVVADGHENAVDKSRSDNESAGLSIEELRSVVRHLGARDAINLDGGGSSTLVINGKLASHPSDASGEREVGDAVVLTR